MSSGTTHRGRSVFDPANHRHSRPTRKHQPLMDWLEARTLLATAARTYGLGLGHLATSLAAPPRLHTVDLNLEPLAPPLHALKHKKTPKPAITASVISGPDANGSL